MSEPNPDDVVPVAAGTLVQAEMWQEVLKEAGIDCRRVGESLSSSFGSAIPDSDEVWVRRADLEKAEAAIRYAEEHRGVPEQSRAKFGRPASDRHGKPGHPTHPIRPYQREPGESSRPAE